MIALVTGSSGLVGSETARHYDAAGWRVHGIDNNMRRDFFGPGGDTTAVRTRLRAETRRFTHHSLDIRDRTGILRLFKKQRFDLVVHCAAQPSHDLAARRPFDDFDINAVGTLNLLEATRQCCPEAAFVFMSTNKVYGDGPNRLPLVELPTRYDFALPAHRAGIPESFPIDHTLHSLFGASKAAADLLVQEYGRYYGLNTVCFRGGCLTGPAHAGVELHGFLSYLVQAAVTGRRYTVYGYKGKQLRDQIHAADVVAAFEAFRQRPRPGAVYNLGGGRENAASLIECVALVERIAGRRITFEYRPEPRRGDHVCYISDLANLRRDFPAWRLTRSLADLVHELVAAHRRADVA
ncbi:MAG: NAD-dependent epimerase/dehydratase family protein [Phycisphaerae bacterium]